ncbi:hypothetical protein BCR37DRAFT_392463 [Protomyces lactucae-debilis]|uniref:Uncharacterized protein n=1 Tax=Protomyces lactucae-debilis TaxID=2754530 RepID=A0A1Y2FJY5_PROLT|nr:uncharacterized protein BCR37DRAFT_392463 [Protomyces lactucae-debilis]ORY83105.1 hypothetical protein BCR37DRAFT_392463 [Protomyces lactucae-debilis]
MVEVQSSGMQTLALIILPIAAPYLLRAYKQLRQPRARPPRPLHTAEQHQIRLLLMLAIFLVCFLATRFFFPKERDVFRATGSRLAISRDLLKVRAAKAGITLPPATWEQIDTIQGALVYLRVGSMPLAHCNWCTMDSPASYAIYALSHIALAYLAHILLLSLATTRRTAFVLLSALAFATEVYARIGGFDYINAQAAEGYTLRGKSTAILFIHTWLPFLRGLFFLATTLAAASLIFVDAYLNRDAASVAHITTLLQQTLEDLRVSSSLNRAITEELTSDASDSGDLARTTHQFWQRHAELIRKIDAQPVMAEARRAVVTRLGEGQVMKDGRELGSFLEAVLARLPDYSAAAASPAS